jgi:hypothetical protein
MSSAQHVASTLRPAFCILHLILQGVVPSKSLTIGHDIRIPYRTLGSDGSAALRSARRNW